MTQERFNELIDKLEKDRAEVLKAKNAKYAPCEDALHNFHTGAEMDGSTPCQTVWHYMKKHMVALLDKINRNDWSDIDDVFEKLGDVMNYLDFLWCAANEEYEKQFILLDETKPTAEPKNNTKNCSTCVYSIMSPDIERCKDCITDLSNGGYIAKNYVEDRDCSDCKHWEICDNEDNWGNFDEGCTKEPCKSCVNNQTPNSLEFLTAPMNWEPLDADT